MDAEQFLTLLFISMKGAKVTASTLHKKFGNGPIAFLHEHDYIEYKPYGKVSGYYYVTPKGKNVCDSVTASLNLIKY